MLGGAPSAEMGRVLRPVSGGREIGGGRIGEQVGDEPIQPPIASERRPEALRYGRMIRRLTTTASPDLTRR